MDVFIIAAQLILSLSILVVLHELGHFIPAKLFKTKVEKFYLFFNPWFSLFKVKKGETEYGIGWLPLGGYVKIAGMIDESMDTEQMNGDPQPWEFRSKPAWQRLIIMIGGIFVNVVTGLIILSLVLLTWGEKNIKNDDLKYGMAVHPFMEQYGIKDGDKIIAIDGEETNESLNGAKHLLFRGAKSFIVMHEDGTKENINFPDDIGYKMFESGAFKNAFEPRKKLLFADSIVDSSFAKQAGVLPKDKLIGIEGESIAYYHEIGKKIKELYADNHKEINLTIVRNRDTISKKCEIDSNYVLGVKFQLDSNSLKVDTTRYGFGEAFSKGISNTYWFLHDNVVQFKYVFTRKGAAELGGFKAMAGLYKPTWDWESFWRNTAIISLILAFMNFLPIPALDGGYILFLLFEMVSGKKPSDSFLEKANTVGFFILITLMILANGNDWFNWLR